VVAACRPISAPVKTYAVVRTLSLQSHSMCSKELHLNTVELLRVQAKLSGT
jgi:hypothetical protein